MSVQTASFREAYASSLGLDFAGVSSSCFIVIEIEIGAIMDKPQTKSSCDAQADAVCPPPWQGAFKDPNLSMLQESLERRTPPGYFLGILPPSISGAGSSQSEQSVKDL